jgi:hypothetical protein
MDIDCARCTAYPSAQADAFDGLAYLARASSAAAKANAPRNWSRLAEFAHDPEDRRVRNPKLLSDRPAREPLHLQSGHVVTMRHNLCWTLEAGASAFEGN